MHLKKIFLILLGISIILSGVIFVLYKNNQSKTEEVIDIFKDNEDEEEATEIEEEKENTEKIFVDIKGMVANPGVYEVDSKARVNDVINIAGGLIEGADTSVINLAKIVTDEMTIIIYSNKEVLEKYREEVCICDCPEITNDACIDNNVDNNNNNEIVNINTATREELMTVSGIGESKSEEIIKYREENGKFDTIDEIKNVSGIGESLFEKIKDHITV